MGGRPLTQLSSDWYSHFQSPLSPHYSFAFWELGRISSPSQTNKRKTSIITLQIAV